MVHLLLLLISETNPDDCFRLVYRSVCVCTTYCKCTCVCVYVCVCAWRFKHAIRRGTWWIPKERWEWHCLRRTPLLWTVFISFSERLLEMCLYSMQNDQRKSHKTVVDWIGYVLLNQFNFVRHALLRFFSLFTEFNWFFFVGSHCRWRTIKSQSIYNKSEVEIGGDCMCSGHNFSSLNVDLVFYTTACSSSYRFS